ncbi:MAG TPA: 3-carboxy-cis,cis-muconate cycloisomerase [Gaiellaceae bacterium]
MPSDRLFGPIFAPDALREAVSDEAWLAALLEAERALAAAGAAAGAIPPEAAEAIASACDSSRFDLAAIGREARGPGNPVEPLVRALRNEAGADAAPFVHAGATSQDVLDTAAMLVARHALDLGLAELDGAARACAALAARHRDTPVAGRTLLQQAVPTTFGLKAAGWLVGLLEARALLVRIRRERLAVQLGGAAGTLAALGDRGPDVLRSFAAELDLAEPVVPWHALRGRVAELGAALDQTAGALAKVALDVTLLSQTEVAEVAEPEGGASSTMPQKRNPIGSVATVAAARRVHALCAVLSGGLAQEHERAAGGWHAEWGPLGEALLLTGGAAARMREVLEGLRVDEARMRSNLTDAIFSERAVVELGLDRETLAQGALRDVLAAELEPGDVERALDPSGYVGSAGALVDRALALAKEELRS